MAGAAALGAIALLPAARAHACGGLFCDGPPPNPLAPLPVAQTGENVAFAMDTDPATGQSRVTAHIQVMYAGPAAKFSWVVPVDAVPELSTGTDQLFTTLAGPTRPVYTTTSVIDGTCIPQPPTAYTGGGGYSGTGSGGATGAADAGAAGTGVTIAFQGAVGPYDAVVLQSGSAAELDTWLTSNGYYLDPNASNIIDKYVQEGKYFVALKLQNGQDVRSIRPIVLTFHGTTPCVPLRLTAIAALPDMPVTVYVLGPSRAVPKGYFELSIDELRIDWLGNGSNYPTLLGQAANEAGGNAFATEFAGASSVLAGQLWTPSRFDTTGLRAAQTPPAYIQALISLGIATDPAVLPLLSQYIPMPAAVVSMGITPLQFYGNISTYWAQYTFPPFDLGTLTDQIVATIIEPRHQAQLMIDGHPYLTRLATYISPEEMTFDPQFALNASLGDVSSYHKAILHAMCGNKQFLYCNAPLRLELPGGQMIWIRNGSTATTCQSLPYDQRLVTSTSLPAAAIVWQRDTEGEGVRRVDNTSMIQAALSAHNIAYPTESKMFPLPLSGAAASSNGGCGCAVGGHPARGALAALAGIVIVAALVRRRRGSPPLR
jgi:MYXO-CTERM domain-containing protein